MSYIKHARQRLIIEALGRDNGQSLNEFIAELNQLKTSGNCSLPNKYELSWLLQSAWKNHNDKIVTLEIFNDWLSVYEKDSYAFIVGQFITSIKHWYELAYHLRLINCHAKTPDIHLKLIEQYPLVSIHQLRRYFAKINKIESRWWAWLIETPAYKNEKFIESRWFNEIA